MRKSRTRLNEIYGVLKKQLSEKDMKSLQGKQRQWIKDRDKQADEDAAYYENGSFAGVQRLSTLG